MSALEALAAAWRAGVKLSLDGDDIIAEASSGVPDEVVEAIKAVKPDLLRILNYFVANREWRGPPDMLFTKIGHPLDEAEAVLVDLLAGVEDALAERGVVLTISGGYVVLTRAEPDLVDRVVAYMAGRVTVSAVPDRLFSVMKQPPADEAAMIAKLKEIEGALVKCGVAMRLEHGHVVLEHRWKGCPPPKDTLNCGVPRMRDAVTVERPIGATEKQWAEAQAGRTRFIDEGWGAKAIKLGWSERDLFVLPTNWHRIRETGVAWLIGRWLVVDVDAKAITVKPPWSSSQLKFYRSRERSA